MTNYDDTVEDLVLDSDRSSERTERRSRGQLVAQILEGTIALDRIEDWKQYRGFNMVVVDIVDESAVTVSVVSNRPVNERDVVGRYAKCEMDVFNGGDGCLVVSNGSMFGIAQAGPKVDHLLRGFEALKEDDIQELDAMMERIEGLMCDCTPFAKETLPPFDLFVDGLYDSEEELYHCQKVFVDTCTSDWRTTSQTLVLLDRIDGCIRYLERDSYPVLGIWNALNVDVHRISAL